MLLILLHTQTDAVLGRACVYMYRRDRYFILILYILRVIKADFADFQILASYRHLFFEKSYFVIAQIGLLNASCVGN